MQLKDSLGNLLEERREKITISSVVAWEKLTVNFIAKEEGEVTVFIDNQDSEPVYFDNLELRVESDPTLVITQEHHYYPFGMNLSGIERQGDLMYQFNGMIEKEEAFGLELYETPFRSYDAQLGRFWQVEPLADIYCGISMYQFGYNNPVSYNDPTGLSVGDGKDEKEEYPRFGDPFDFTPIDGRVIGDYSPRGSSGSKIGGGGYTWDLGNTRGSPYSMGGTPGRGPGRISIFNLNNDPEVTAGIAKAKKFLHNNGVNIDIVEKNKVDLHILNPNRIQNPISLAQGKNAAYLFGEGDELIKYTNIIDNSFTRGATEMVANSMCQSCIENSTSGGKGSENNTNIAVIGTHRLKFFTGKNFSKIDAVALTILHVMGHNANIGEHNDHWNSSVKGKDGVGERARAGIMHAGDDLIDFISSGATFEYITDMSTNSNGIEVNKMWLSNVKSYFDTQQVDYNSFYNYLFKK